MMINNNSSKLIRFLLLTVFLFNYGTRSMGVEVHGNASAWFLVLSKIQLADKWSFANEFHVRRDNWLEDQQQLIIRPAINFDVSPGFVATGGYSFIRNSPYGKYPIATATPEHNFWEQITLSHSVKKFNISHRYRLEHQVKRIKNLTILKGTQDPKQLSFSFS